MRRQGKYTKRSSVKTAKFTTRKYFLWFHNLKRWQKIGVIVGPIAVVMLLIPLLTYAYFARDINDKERLMNRNNTGIVMTDRNGSVIYRTGRSQHRDVVPLDQISDHAKEALISSEDKNFYDHGGFSFIAILGALYVDILTGSKDYGGSTITQQLAKNTLLTDKKTFLRKYQELSIAIAIEQTYSKDEILDMYLNSVFFGGTIFGIEDAAETYFDKHPSELSLAESSMLIGLLPAPNAYSPIYGSEKYAKERQETVLTRMVSNEVITEEEKEATLAVELNYAEQTSESDDSPAPHFAQAVIKQLEDEYGDEKVARSGMQVKTTLDLDEQENLQQQIDANMPRIRSLGGSNVAAVEVDPKTGNVLALIGSYDWDDPDFGKVDMANSLRQPGSSYKPIYYSEALAQGLITPATIFTDEETDFNGYEPRNATERFYGDVTVRKALSWSLNIPSVKVMRKFGIQNAVETSEKMGLTSINSDKDYGLSLALGSAEVKLSNMVHAYAGFANEGMQMKLQHIESVKDKYNESIYEKTESSTQTITPQGAYLISDILSDNAARAGMFGGSLSVPGKDVAVKTGTTDQQRDAWTIGYTPNRVIGVWVGNNDNSPMENGGGEMAGPIWRGAMTYALRNTASTSFPQPDGIVERLVCFGTGKLASHAGTNTYNDVFLATALPSYGCNVEEEPEEETKPKPEDEDESSSEDDPDTPNGSGGGDGNNGNGNGGGNGNGDDESGDGGSDGGNDNPGGNNGPGDGNGGNEGVTPNS